MSEQVNPVDIVVEEQTENVLSEASEAKETLVEAVTGVIETVKVFETETPKVAESVLELVVDSVLSEAPSVTPSVTSQVNPISHLISEQKRIVSQNELIQFIPKAVIVLSHSSLPGAEKRNVLLSGLRSLVDVSDDDDAKKDLLMFVDSVVPSLVDVFVQTCKGAFGSFLAPEKSETTVQKTKFDLKMMKPSLKLKKPQCLSGCFPLIRKPPQKKN